MKKKLIIKKHILIPKHQIVSDKEKKELYGKYNISMKELPKILKTDSAVVTLKAKVGDIVKITRKSPTAGEVIFYRGVINE